MGMSTANYDQRKKKTILLQTAKMLKGSIMYSVESMYRRLFLKSRVYNNLH